MENKIDYKTLRFMPLAFSALMLILLINMGTSGLFSILLSGVKDENIIRNYEGIISITHMLKYVGVVGVFVCIYLLAAANRWLKYSVQMAVLFVFCVLAESIAVWVFFLTNGNAVAATVFNMIQMLPDLCIMFMVGALIRGLYELRSTVNDRRKKRNAGDDRVQKKPVKERRSRDLIFNMWIIAEICMLCFTAILRNTLRTMDTAYRPLAIVVLCLALVYYTVVAVAIVTHIRGVCYDYYIFMYNQSAQSGGFNV